MLSKHTVSCWKAISFQLIITAYEILTEHVINFIEACFSWASNYMPIRLHGGFHMGNILWTEVAPLLLTLTTPEQDRPFRIYIDTTKLKLIQRQPPDD